MIDRLIEWSLRHRGVVIGVYLALAVAGYVALRTSAIDALPDLSDNQVIVFTDWAGHSAQEVEDQVTYPLTVNLQGLAGVRVVRSQSAFGFSMIYVVFEDGVDLYFARTRVLERLGLVATALPAGVVPTLGPDATGVGHVFWYTVERTGTSLPRSAQPAGLVRPLSAQLGARRGGSRVGRRHRPAVPDRRRSRTGCAPIGVSLGDVVDARSAEQRQRRRQRRRGERRVVDRARRRPGRSPRRIWRTSSCAPASGVPVTVKQVAEVTIGDAFRVVVARQGHAGSRRRRHRRALGRQHAAT